MLFAKHPASNGVTILHVYVEDIIITRDDMTEANQLSSQLSSKFEIKSFGRLKIPWNQRSKILRMYIYLTTEIYPEPFQDYRETCM